MLIGSTVLPALITSCTCLLQYQPSASVAALSKTNYGNNE